MWNDFDILRFALQLLPPVLRRTRLFALLRVLAGVPAGMAAEFRRYRQETLARLAANGQAASMEKALNDAFLLDGGGIFITTGDKRVWADSLLFPTEEGTMAVFPARAERAACVPDTPAPPEGQADFAVNVPSFLSDDGSIAEVRRIVEYNKPAGRTYTIKTYEYE